MDCKGIYICNEDESESNKVLCPGSNNNFPHKLQISNSKYKDICQEPQHQANVAYNNDVGWFEVDENGTDIKKEKIGLILNSLYLTDASLDEWYGMSPYPVRPIAGAHSSTSYDWEILTPFFQNYHIKPTWLDCNYTWGWFDEETGHWTGAVGKVNIEYIYKYICLIREEFRKKKVGKF